MIFEDWEGTGELVRMSEVPGRHRKQPGQETNQKSDSPMTMNTAHEEDTAANFKFCEQLSYLSIGTFSNFFVVGHVQSSLVGHGHNGTQ